MTDQQLLERRVRETLATRADGVAATPALYERVQRGIRRDRRWGLARAWAMLTTIVVLAGLVIVALPSDEVAVDVVDDPADTIRNDGDGSTEDADGGTDTALPSDLPFGGVGYAVQDDDALTLFAPDGSTRLEVPVAEGRAVDLAVSAGWLTDGGVVAVLHAGPDGVRDIRVFGPAALADGPAPTARFGGLEEIAPDGDRIAVLPDGRAVVWIQDRSLGVLPLTPDGEVRVATARYVPLELPAGAPERLVAQQVVEHDDGTLTLFATDPDGREAWSLPLVTDAGGEIAPADASLEDGEVQPAGTRFPGPVPGLGAVLDVMSLPDGSMLSLEAPTDGGDAPFLRRTTFEPRGEDQVQLLPDLLWPNDGGFELDSGGGWQVTLHDGERGIVHRYLIDPEGSGAASLATSRGAGVAIAAVHIGADAAAWGTAAGWEDELAALMEQELREQLAKASALVDAQRAEIARLEEQLEQATAEAEVQEIERQLDDHRRALERQMLMVAAAQAELEARRLEAAAGQGLLTGWYRTYRVDDGRIVSTGGNKPDPGAAPFPDEQVELGLVAANPAGSVFPDTLADLVVEVDRGTNRDLHLVAYTDGGNVQGPDGRTDVPAEATVAPLALGLDGPLTGLVRSPDGRWVAWTTSATFGLAEVNREGLEIAAAFDVPTDLPVVDWVWEEHGEIAGVGFAAPGRGTQRMTVDLDANDGVLMRSPEPVSSTEVRVRLVDASGALAGVVTLPASLDRVRWSSGGDEAAPPVWRAGEPTMRLTQGPGGVLVTIGSAAWMIDLDADFDGWADDAPTIRELPSGTRAIG